MNNKSQILDLVKRAPALKDLPKPAVEEVVQLISRLTVQEVMEFRQHSGPLPPADELKRYNEIVNNGAERIMIMAESQHNHRISIEAKVINSQQTESRRGQIIAAAIVILLIISGTWLGLSKQTAVAVTIFGTTVLGVAGVFAAGKFSQSRDLSKKRAHS